MHDFKFKILKGEWNNDNSKYSTEIIFRVDYNPVPSGYNPYLGFGPIYFGKEYINLSTAGISTLINFLICVIVIII